MYGFPKGVQKQFGVTKWVPNSMQTFYSNTKVLVVMKFPVHWISTPITKEKEHLGVLQKF